MNYSHSYGSGKKNGRPQRRCSLLALIAISTLVFAALPIEIGSAAELEMDYVAASGTDQLPTALIELDGTGSENPDGGSLEYYWIQVDGPRVDLSDPTSPKPYFRTGRPGLYRFQLTVSSNGLKSDPFMVEIMIERDNQPPIAKVLFEVLGEVDQEMEIDGSPSYDPEGAELTYRWRLLTPGLDIPLDIMHLPILRFMPRQDGVFELELVVSDGETVSKPSVVRLAIKPKPRPPVARARAVPREIPATAQQEQAMAPPGGGKPLARIEGPSTAKLGELITLDARGSRGHSGKKLDYMWRQKSGPFVSDFELVFDGAAERFKPPRSGDYEFELIVSDGARESEPTVHRIQIVNDIDPPVAVVTAPVRSIPGALVKMDATQSYDVEGSPLTYRWRQTGGPRVTKYLIGEALGDSCPAFHPPSVGTYSFELVVSNGRLKSKPVEINVEVEDPARRALQLSIAGPNIARTGDHVILAVRVENGDTTRYDFVWRQSDGPVIAMSPVNGTRASVSPPAPGRYVFDVTALENGQVAGSERRIIEVFSHPSQPSIEPAAPTHATAPALPLRPIVPAGSSFMPIVPPAPVSAPLATPPAASPTASFETVANVPPLAPLVDMPALPPAAKAPAGRGQPTGRAAAQIHPSTLGGS